MDVRNFYVATRLHYVLCKMFLQRVFRPERRRWPRHWFNTSVQVFKESAQLDARGVTLSDGGMSLITLSNLPLGAQVEVEFLPPRSRDTVRLAGRVRSRALYLYGIEFLGERDCLPVHAQLEA
jgi:hypothetical protein